MTNFVTVTPVKTSMMRKIRNAKTMSAIPAIAKVIVCWAEAVAFWSPPEVRNLNPPTISMTKRPSTKRPTAILRILPKTTSRHLKVGISTPPIFMVHEDQFGMN